MGVVHGRGMGVVYINATDMYVNLGFVDGP